jgi:hypothetical protein
MTDSEKTQGQAAGCCPDGCRCCECISSGQFDPAAFMKQMMETCGCGPSDGASDQATGDSGRGCC